MSKLEPMKEAENETPVSGGLVVVGSSAGGIEALSILVSSLPAGFPAPIVLAQHLDPNRPSSLDTILQRRTTLAVEVVNSRSRLEAGKIYVVPANRHVAIYDSHVEVQGDHGKRPRPSVDLLLSSAAEVYGEHLIAVILTGTGSDGASGAVDVKNAGGIVIVQDPKTARYPSMPLALPPTVIDFEAEIEKIGTLLNDLLTGAHLPLPEEKTEDVLRNILEQVSRQASIDFRPYKTSTILRRIGRRMTITRCSTMQEYLDYLKTYPAEVGNLVKAFLINVTQFFRDPEAFNFLKTDILPNLVERARDHGRTLRFWTAGCATGEEPYSLAMLIADRLDRELPEWNIKIFATDLDEASIIFARRGLYSNNLLQGIPKDYSDRFFERAEHGYRISKTLRQMVVFGQQNLSRSAPFPRIDLILCRNVLIYFTPELQEYVLNQFAFSLSAGGYLFLGKAETVRPLQLYYELVNKRWKIYRCLSNPLPSARRSHLSELNVSRLEEHSKTGSHKARAMTKRKADQEFLSPGLEIGQLRHFNEMLFRFLPIGIVMIDRTYHVLTANGTARRLLGLREVPTEQDFLHAVRGIPYSEVRVAIDAVFRERTLLSLPEVELDISAGGNGHFLSLSFAPLQLDAGMPDRAIISVADVTEQVQTHRQLEAVQSNQAQLMQELSAANKRLNDNNKDLLDANEELQVTNEELVLTHEELQASIEEFETTNEELQASNEELETNNEELQATNEELETTNDELRVRTGELQEMTSLLESERVRLVEMVGLAPFYITVLRGPNLLVEASNPHYAGLMEGKTVPGRPLDQAFELFGEAGLPILHAAHEVYQRDVTRTISRLPTRMPDAHGETTLSYFVYTLVPSHDANGKVSGVIIYAIDETVQRAREIEAERERLALIFNHASIVALALYDAQTTELILGSPRYLDLVASLHKLDRNSLIGRKYQDLSIISPAEDVMKLWYAALESHSEFCLPEFHLKLPSSEEDTIWEWCLTPLLDNEKQSTVRFMLISKIEITELVQARQELERLNRLKDDFLSLASHELRNPLTSILGNAELLQHSFKRLLEGVGSSKEQRPGFEREQNLASRIIHQVKHLNKLISDMQDITRIRSEQFELKYTENINIVALARQVVENQMVITDHPLRLETQQQELLGTWDEGRLEQVLNNLVSNALKYGAADKPVVVGIERKRNEVIVSVRNEGSGINEEEQTHIFDRFYRIRSNKDNVDGLGLGLYIAREIVVQQGGRMWLESKVGEGSTFYFSLPLTIKAEK